MDLTRLHAEQQCEQSGDHQALDMVPVAVIDDLADSLAQAGGVGLRAPVERR